MDPAPATPQSTFRLNPRGEIRDEAARVFTEEIAVAVAELRDRSMPPDLAVHSVRKRIKRLRALLRLFRSELGSGFGSSNQTLRDAGRILSDFRDARVAVETLDRLAERQPDLLQSGRPASLEGVRRALAESAEGTDSAALRRSVASTLESISRWPRGWRFTRSGFQAMEGGLRRTYRQGRSALAEARADGSPSASHEWRKRAKDHWHHTQLIAQPGQRGMRTRDLRLHDLSEALGEIQDLRVLDEALDTLGLGSPAGLPEAMAAERRNLDQVASGLGGTLYRYRPATIVARYAAAWSRARGPAA